MVVSCTRENKQMEEELAILETKFKDLGQKFLGIHLFESLSNPHIFICSIWPNYRFILSIDTDY